MRRREKCRLALEKGSSFVLLVEEEARKPKTTFSGATLQSSPTAERESDSGPATGPPINPLSRMTCPTASMLGTLRRRRAPATLPFSPFSASMTNEAVAVQ